jgi:hypothetical protein
MDKKIFAVSSSGLGLFEIDAIAVLPEVHQLKMINFI